MFRTLLGRTDQEHCNNCIPRSASLTVSVLVVDDFVVLVTVVDVPVVVVDVNVAVVVDDVVVDTVVVVEVAVVVVVGVAWRFTVPEEEELLVDKEEADNGKAC